MKTLFLNWMSLFVTKFVVSTFQIYFLLNFPNTFEVKRRCSFVLSLHDIFNLHRFFWGHIALAICVTSERTIHRVFIF